MADNQSINGKVMRSLHTGRFDGKELPDHAEKSRLKWLWDLAERMDWSERWPKPFWRWLLRKCDEINGHQGLDYDY
jgi:hypothetical protein